MMKRIKEIFSDYDATENINTAIVEGVVLCKKTKSLEMKIKSDKYIELREKTELITNQLNSFYKSLE